MESTVVLNTSPPLRMESPSTTEASEKFNLSDYLSKNYIIIVIPSAFAGIFLIILFVVLIKKILNRRRINSKQLETYSSVTYDDETDEELGNSDDLMYTSCRLLVGGEYEENSDMTNSEPEYDCMSVDFSVNANESSIVNWNKKENPEVTTQELAQSSKTLPLDFWKR